MEMHQIRYFLGVARTLNFTRAAEECHVSQPSLTRAIKLLEEELGGELFRRERNHSHLTDLGQRMLPLLQQCYETAQGAKMIATQVKKGEIATLRLALSRSVDLAVLIPFLSELMRAFNGLDLKFLRGTGDEVAEIMKRGDADLAIAGPMPSAWDRFDSLPLFTEGYVLALRQDHRLAGQTSVGLADISRERLLTRIFCENAQRITASLRSHGGDGHQSHEVSSEIDMMALLNSGIGIAIVPRSTLLAEPLRAVPLTGIELSRTVYIHSVAGRPRAAPAATLLRQLKAADWSGYGA